VRNRSVPLARIARPGRPARRAARTLAVALALLALLALAAPAAHAEDHALLVSRNGSDWTETLDGSLFGSPTVVPGDRLVRSLHLRNSSDLATTLWLYLVDSSPASSGLPEHIDVSAGHTGDLGAPVGLGGAIGDIPLIRPVELDAGQSVALQVAVEFDDGAGTDAQGGQAAFDLVVRLAERIPEPASPSPVTAEPTAPSDDLDTAGGVTPGNGPTPSAEPSPATSGPRSPSPGVADPTPVFTSEVDRPGEAELVIPGLSDDSAPGTGGPPLAAPAAGGSGILPDTGGPARLQQQTALAVGAIGTGIVLMAASRRRRGRAERAAR
jgi:hypothetical protein